LEVVAMTGEDPGLLILIAATLATALVPVAVIVWLWLREEDARK
jgi:hypothetical protein